MMYGYCRISTPKQSIERQIRNIVAAYPDAKIVQETYTGKKMLDRPEWNKLYNRVKSGDTIVFDSVSRMSCSAEDGIKTGKLTPPLSTTIQIRNYKNTYMNGNYSALKNTILTTAFKKLIV